MGGWTFGYFTILAALIAPIAARFAALPQIVGPLVMIGSLLLHVMWGAHGYYPMRFHFH